MSEFTKALIVSPLSDGRTWVLAEPFSYDVGRKGSGDTIRVPALFMTDFASVPRVFWSVFPPWGRYGNAAVIHDYGYWTQTRRRARVDAIFLEGMEVLGVGWWARHVLYWNVRLFGWFAWRRDRARRRAGVTMFAAAMPARTTESRDQVRTGAPPAAR